MKKNFLKQQAKNSTADLCTELDPVTLRKFKQRADPVRAQYIYRASAVLACPWKYKLLRGTLNHIPDLTFYNLRASVAMTRGGEGAQGKDGVARAQNLRREAGGSQLPTDIGVLAGSQDV
ncbi:unnamed protein product, partial [Mesorhabditis spiculigera]